MTKEYETVIGLEVHVELATRTKIFCSCSTAFGSRPNTHICPVCTGMPGALPVLNRKVVEHAVAVGLALGCSITGTCRFDRKNYFYPDNPQNYQISQLYLPVCRNGSLEIETESGRKTVGIHEIHMEEDAGKLIHDEAGEYSLIDYNRSGVPLIEIVSEPDMANAQEAIAYLEKLRMMIQYLGASDCKMQEGSMRADVNLSVRQSGSKELGTRTEMKNLNSFREIANAVKHERERQIALLESGQQVFRETRRWDEGTGCSYSMRSKEDARDYRYFPEPDLPPLQISDEWLADIRRQQPEFRTAKMARYRQEYGIPEDDIEMLTASRQMAELFEKTTELCKLPKKVSNWLIGETMRLLKEKGMDSQEVPFIPEHLAKLILLVEDKVITGAVAKEVFAMMFVQDMDPEAYVEAQGLKMVSDDGILMQNVKQIITDNPGPVADYRHGKEKAVGYLVGQVMKAMHGKADAEKVRSLLESHLLS